MTALRALSCLLLLGTLGCQSSLGDAGYTQTQNPTDTNCTPAECPFGSNPNWDQSSGGKCNNSATTSTLTGDGRIDGVCQGTGSCRVWCSLVQQCCKGFHLSEGEKGKSYDCEIPCSGSSSDVSESASAPSKSSSASAGMSGARTPSTSSGPHTMSSNDAGEHADAANSDSGTEQSQDIPSQTESTEPGDNPKAAAKLGDLLMASAPVVAPAKFGFIGGSGSDAENYFEFALSHDASWTIAVALSGVQNSVTAQLFPYAQIIDEQKPYFALTATMADMPKVSTQILAKGTYYVRVIPYGQVQSLYQLTQSASEYSSSSGEEPSKDPGRGVKDALDVGALGAEVKTYRGYVGGTDDLDNYHVSLAGDGTLQLSGSNVEGGVSIAVYDFSDPLDTTKRRGSPLTVTTMDQTLEVNVPKGKYIISVSRSGSSLGNLYTLGLQWHAPQ